MEPRQIFGINLLQARLDMDLSQESLGDRVGLHRSEISRFESGKRDPRLAMIVRLARGLGIPPMELLDGIR